MKPLFCLLFIVLTGISSAGAQSIRRLDNSRISQTDLSGIIEHLVDSAKVSGLEIAVFNKKKPVYVRAFGYADVSARVPLDTSHIFYSASFSKAVFAYLVMRLCEQKRISLDTPLVSYLTKPLYSYPPANGFKGYSDLKSDPRHKKITARMCLDHTSGLPNYREYEFDQKIRIKAEPGSRYMYSGEGIMLLQFVLEQITGSDLESLAREQVFIPLQMTQSSYVWQKDYEKTNCTGHDKSKSPYGRNRKMTAHADASLYTSITDYSRFYSALLQHTGLKKSSFAEMISPQVHVTSRQQMGPNAMVDVAQGEQDNLNYGLGLGLLKTTYGTAFFKEGHDAGWQHYSVGFPKKGIAVIIMSNSDNAEKIFDQLLQASVADTFTPCYWENYCSLSQNPQKP